MHCLTGTYLKQITDELIAEGKDGMTGKQYHPIKIVIPPSKSRIIFTYTNTD